MSKRPAHLAHVYTRLFSADVKELKARSKKSGIPWQTQLRSLMHAVLAGTGASPSTPRDQRRLSIVVANSREEAAALLKDEAIDGVFWAGAAEPR